MALFRVFHFIVFVTRCQVGYSSVLLSFVVFVTFGLANVATLTLQYDSTVLSSHYNLQPVD